MKFSIKKSFILATLATVSCVYADTTVVSETVSVPTTTFDDCDYTITTTITTTTTTTISDSEIETETIIPCGENEIMIDQVCKCIEGFVKVGEECVKENEEEDNVYMDMIKQFDFGDEITYVIGHKSPDCDTVGSAIAFADLLNKIGIKAQAAVSGPLNGETNYYFKLFGIKSPELLTNAEGKQFVLVDHSNYLQAIDGMKSARIVGIIDHHNVGDITSEEPIYARFNPVGAAASIIYLIYNELNVPISKEIAQVMIMSILSDTNNLTNSITRNLDRNALAALKKIAEIDDVDTIYKGMSEAKASYEGMPDDAIYQSDYKEYEINGKFFCVGVVNASDEAKLKEMSDRMYNYIEENYETSGFNMMFAMVQSVSENEDEDKTYLFGYGEDADKILNGAFGDFDGKYYITKDVLSRKKDVIPVITEYLNNLEN